jgi:2-oxo-3-hexenedioate decarboxylase
MGLGLGKEEIHALARTLDEAQRERRLIPKITQAHPDIGVQEAYRVQRELQRRRELRGHRLIGYKMGLTSPAKMKQIGIDSPVFGFLTDDYRCADGASVDISELVQPRAEPEIAFITTREITGGGCTVETILAATAFLAPAIEILDSRFAGFKIDIVSGIADNTSAAKFLVSRTQTPPAGISLAALGVRVEKNGKTVAEGVGANVLGDPARSVAMLADMLNAENRTLPAGSIVLSGGITEAIPVSRGDTILVAIESLGDVSVSFF